MARDSIIAKPTNKVRVMVAEASGCCASEVSAATTARPSPSAGAMTPMAVVRPHMMIEPDAMIVRLSIGGFGAYADESAWPRRWPAGRKSIRVHQFASCKLSFLALLWCEASRPRPGQGGAAHRLLYNFSHALL